MNKTKINNLYDHYKNTPKKLKIVCDWDEVIQATEPYSLYLTIRKKRETNKPFGIKYKELDFATFFKHFWDKNEDNWWEMDYSPRGSDLKMLTEKESWKECEIRSNFFHSDLENPTDFYQQAPFLTIAEDLLKLIKEDKVEKLIFLSTGDDRKIEVFRETFRKLAKSTDKVVGVESDVLGERVIKESNIQLRLMSEEIKTQGTRTKADWIKVNASDFDIFIDDNPFICRSLIESNRVIKPCEDCAKYKRYNDINCKSCEKMNITVIAPYYPAIENQHDERVLLVKNEVSNLKKEDFKN